MDKVELRSANMSRIYAAFDSALSPRVSPLYFMLPNFDYSILGHIKTTREFTQKDINEINLMVGLKPGV